MSDIMSDIKNITLAFPCHQQLTRNAAGEFCCNACAHTIVDFRCQSAGALAAALRQSSRPVCGIFNSSQLSQQFVRYAAATAIAVSAAAGTMCTSEPQLDEPPGTPMENPEVAVPMVGFVAEVIATPVGGYEKFKDAVQQSLRYPKGICAQGTVFVQFIVDKSGKTKDFKVVKGFHPAADSEALRVMESLDYEFEPARQDGMVVSCRMVMPVRF